MEKFSSKSLPVLAALALSDCAHSPEVPEPLPVVRSAEATRAAALKVLDAEKDGSQPDGSYVECKDGISPDALKKRAEELIGVVERALGDHSGMKESLWKYLLGTTGIQTSFASQSVVMTPGKIYEDRRGPFSVCIRGYRMNTSKPPHFIPWSIR